MYRYFLTITALILLNSCSTTSAETGKTEGCVIMPPHEPRACTMQYDPVCGCNDKTYSNACMAAGAGVPRSTPGACGENANN